VGVVLAGGGEGSGEGAVADGVNDVVVGDSVPLEDRLPVDGLGGPVGVLGTAASGQDGTLERDPGCQGDWGGDETSVGGDDVAGPEARAAVEGVDLWEAGGSDRQFNARFSDVDAGPDQGVVGPEGGDCYGWVA
jgi:hypothetical protein